MSRSRRSGGPGSRRGRGPSGGRGRKPSFKTETLDVVIDHVGGHGDGVAVVGDRRLYIPLTAPGDRVRVSTVGPQGDGVAAVVDDVLEPGPDRVSPPCPHVGACGGCALQHLGDAAYGLWKTDQLRLALQRRGLGDVPMEPLVRVPAGTRRRVSWAVDRAGRVGFTARKGRDVAAIDRCLLLVDELNGLLPRVGVLAKTVAGLTKVQATVVDDAIDMVMTGPAELSLDDREALAAFADDAALARLSWKRDDDDVPETVSQRTPPRVLLSGVAVPFPPGMFLQPSAAGEAALAAAVVSGLDGARVVADLFAGLGTFSLALLTSTNALITAVEADVNAVAALAQGAGQANLGGRCRTEVRDLFAQPLSVKELEPFDAVIFDPPRAGAAAQAATLADSAHVERIVAVSCNPATFARDVRLLVDGGYALQTVQPVDQFPYAAHLEVVGVLARK